MIGSISKVRPCGHHHYYKYAHATEGRHPDYSNGKKYDMYQVSREYWNDVDEDNCWNFSLENAKRLSDCCFELGTFTKFKSKTPKLTYAYQMFTGDNGRKSPAVTEIEMDYDNLTNVYCLFYGMRLNDLPANFNPSTTNLNHLLGGNCAMNIGRAHNNVFPYYEVLNNATDASYLMRHDDCAMDDNYTFEKAIIVNGMCYCNTYVGPLRLSKKLSFKNVESMNRLVQQAINAPSPAHITFFQTVDEMSKLTTALNAFYHCTQLSSLYPDYDSFSWPKLSTASGMFNGCILDKPSILKLKDALPDWSGDTTEHNITIGCHIDHKYDPEVNVALKKLQSSYLTPIEESGGSLSETVAADKGWTIIVQWNGTTTENAYPAPTV